MTKMYQIEDNRIVAIAQFGSETDGTEQGYVALTQSTEPSIDWTRVDENSDFTDTRDWYQKRTEEYGTYGKQLDLIYQDIVNGTLDTTGAFYTHINTIKTNNPKS